MRVETETKKQCYHCGEWFDSGGIFEEDDKCFCCRGCAAVYQLLKKNDLLQYYDLDVCPGILPDSTSRFDYLENSDIVSELLEFDENNIQRLTFFIPNIHCSSCVWLLEHLGHLHRAILSSVVHFPKKEVQLVFKSDALNVKELVILLAKLGYEPDISLQSTHKSKTKKQDRNLLIQLGVAGFAFGNIMFLSFPEYFESNEFWLERYKHLFRWLMFAFSLPVVFFSSTRYFVSALKGIQSKNLNIDLPIALGIATLFVRSTVDVAMDWGTGFFDSLSGLVFFLLLGKFFQQKTYAFLSFERDYKSFFPLAVTKLIDQKKNNVHEEQIPIESIQKRDRIFVRNAELIPIDAVLLSKQALIDYSFVTGEHLPVSKKTGDKLFAGGRLSGTPVEIEALNSFSKSELIQLWEHDAFDSKKRRYFQTLTDAISKRFAIGVLLIALVATTYWLLADPSQSLHVFTAVLIVACPCAIALAAPFALGNILRIFGLNKLYLKKDIIIEQLAQTSTIVFDKTGTLTTTKATKISYDGQPLSSLEGDALVAVLRGSSHPLSRMLYDNLKHQYKPKKVDFFEEIAGEGVFGRVDKIELRLGSFPFVVLDATVTDHQNDIERTRVHIAVNESYKGYYTFSNNYRTGISDLVQTLQKDHEVVVLSGDREGERAYLQKTLGPSTRLLFNQRPSDKLHFIKELQSKGKNILMVGDGLNDSGALAQSDVGIALVENTHSFSPASDGILDASALLQLPKFLHISKKTLYVIRSAFVFSLLYNIIGLGFAVTGQLTPLVAAILMPLSSISIIIFTTLLAHRLGRGLTKKTKN